MTRWTEAEYIDWQGRRWQREDSATNSFTEVPDDGPESRLAGKISKWAKTNGFPILNFRQSKKAAGFIPVGFPDVTLVLPNRVVFLELKSATGRLRKEQHEVARQFAYLKNAIYVVKSYKRFLEIVNEKEAL
jgi:hypothetical protein